MAILYFTPHLSRVLFQHTPDPLESSPPWWKKIARQITIFLMVTISAIVGTAPIVAFYFHRLSPWGWLTNLIIIPLIGFLVVPLGLVTSLLVFFFQPLAAVNRVSLNFCQIPRPSASVDRALPWRLILLHVTGIPPISHF